MYTVDTPHNEIGNILPEWHEPFPVPQTIPAGWDLSEVMSASATTVAEDPDEGVEN